jgi:hypothetical protein
MTALAILIALGPLAGPTAAIAGARARLAGIAQAAGALVAFGCALALLAELDGHPPLAGWDGFLYVDPLGGFFAMTVAGVTLLAALGSIGYVCAEEDSGAFGGFQVRLYYGIGPAAGEPLNRVMLPPHAAADFPRLGHRPPQPLDGVHARHTVEGQAFEFPFGPVRQVGMESLYYGLVTSGEEVVDLYLFTWHKHRGVEWRLRGPERSRSSWNGCTTMPRPWRRCARPLGCRWARPPPRSRWNGCCESTPLRSATGICSASSPLVE